MPPRVTKSQATRQIQQTLVEAAVYGAKLLLYNLRGKDSKGRKMPRVANSKLNAAKIAIDHAIGLPKAKIELKTDALTMKDIAEIAALFDNNVAESAQKSEQNDDENSDIMHVPTKPLTARQVRERAKN